eukprot:scaffold67161_cov57-Phaeocystis_antarctica.AAC.1
MPMYCCCSGTGRWRRPRTLVGQRGREADDADHLLRRLDLAHGARDDALEHGAAVVVQQVNLVDDGQPYELRVRAVAALA